MACAEFDRIVSRGGSCGIKFVGVAEVIRRGGGGTREYLFAHRIGNHRQIIAIGKGEKVADFELGKRVTTITQVMVISQRTAEMRIVDR